VRRWLIRIALALVALVALAQAVPYGRSHSNPQARVEPTWDSPRTRELAAGACFDCHSNLTTWPWYSNIAPVSWLLTSDVNGGRGALNFSEWSRAQDTSAGEIVEAVRNGSMPPWFYKPLHAGARLSSSERAALVAGLVATLRASPPR
jgi:mono/diheme cytochrome c family protein